MKVNYLVENTRVGQRTDYDRVILEICTQRRYQPKEALLYAANILQRHLDVFVSYGQLPEEQEEEEEISAEEEAIYEKLRLPVSELELSVRAPIVLKTPISVPIADLVRKTESSSWDSAISKKSLNEINELRGHEHPFGDESGLQN